MFVPIEALLQRQFFIDTMIPAIAGLTGLSCFLSSAPYRTEFPSSKLASPTDRRIPPAINLEPIALEVVPPGEPIEESR
jgi:hypothetical protein